jgi:large subunit ribosomal protein L13e
LRPAVRGQTNRYNSRVKLGRGFTPAELKLAGITSLPLARSIGICVDLRRRNTCNETLNMNANRVKTYLSKIVVHRAPVKGSKNVPSKLFKEVNFKESTDPAVKVQNTTRDVIRILLLIFFSST